MNRDDENRSHGNWKSRAGISDRECPAKSKLIDALLRGESPECKPVVRKKRRRSDAITALLEDTFEDDGCLPE